MKPGMLWRIREGKSVLEEVEAAAQKYRSDTGETKLCCAVDPSETKKLLPKRILRGRLVVNLKRRGVGKGQIWIGIDEE